MTFLGMIGIGPDIDLGGESVVPEGLVESVMKAAEYFIECAIACIGIG